MENAPNPEGKYPGSWWIMSFDKDGKAISDDDGKGVGNAHFDWNQKDEALKFLHDLEKETGVNHEKLYPKKPLQGKGWLMDQIMLSRLEKQAKQLGYTWKSYAEVLGQNPSNFKRQLIKKVDQLNNWLAPLNLQIQIAPKGESGEEKRKEKD